VVPRCAYCGKPLTGQYLIDQWGTKFCKEHMSQYPTCAYCGRLVPPQQQEHASGDEQNMRCPVCRSTAIDTFEEAQPFYQKVKKWVSSQGLTYNNLHLRLELCDRDKLASLQNGPAITHQRGITRSSTYTENGHVVRTQVDGIAVLRGMPSIVFEGVTVHELGHAWLTVHGIRPLPLWAEEGFCELLAYRYYMDLATDESRYHAKNIEQNPDPVYGEGFRRMRAMADSMGFQRFVNVLLTTKRLPAG
jgi:DNA-directed RNA polymerase subunit RPC12/RpoP